MKGKMSETFEELRIWQEARALCNEMYKHFGESRNYAYRDQIIRASMSVMNNIAEGFDRNSTKQFLYFLNIAKGSCSEVKSMLYLAIDQNMIPKEDAEVLKDKADSLVKMIGKFRSHLNHSLPK
jgi:four helix bundle protein